MPLQASEGLGSGNFCEFSTKGVLLASVQGDSRHNQPRAPQLAEAYFLVTNSIINPINKNANVI